MRTLVNFMRRDGWFIHCLAADCRTLISRWIMVRSDQTLLRLFKASGATPPEVDEIERDIRRWGGAAPSSKSICPRPDWSASQSCGLWRGQPPCAAFCRTPC
jgi:hypothetical protein